MDKVKDFEADTTKGKMKLSDILKQRDFVVVYFYPKAFTSGCTQELKRFVELYEEFKKLNTEILGVSNDSLDTQKKFAEKYGAEFPLVADKELKIINTLGAKSERGQGASRITYIVNKNMEIIETLKSLPNAKEHADKSLEIIKSHKK
ncbi:peroxiredoxin [Nanobdella aerobiophila]|uniref:thioredoxin-dependent peroxiredoxin n=1 Tax=Nanobdella aerobiophila TaxID=2586965 RepID=A0A915WRK5_9ARCH|nr:peroxiredoxin [Nanobdella aerobiophila]BBL45324.1 peroxiredoxin [Nanobdella aerobiophila]